MSIKGNTPINIIRIRKQHTNLFINVNVEKYL